MLPWHCNEIVSYPAAPLKIRLALRSNAGRFVIKLSYVFCAPSEVLPPHISKEKCQQGLDGTEAPKDSTYIPITLLNISPTWLTQTTSCELGRSIKGTHCVCSIHRDIHEDMLK